VRAKVIYFKYLYYIVRCGSIKKFYNYFLNRIEKWLRKASLNSLPVNVMIEPCNICNLKCPGCITGIKHPDAIKPLMLHYDQFKKIFDPVKEYLFSISFYNWGEPFLNSDIFSMINYAVSNRCAVTLHSNFNVFNEGMAEKAILSRLTHIYLSIDGATQKTYEKYRVGGSLSRVLENIGILVDKKKEMRSHFPILTWKYLVFPHNVHEIEMARQRSEQLQVDGFEVFFGNLDNVATFGSETRYDPATGKAVIDHKHFCDSLWDTLIVYPDGSVIPCCQSFRERDVFGNLNERSMGEIWNNDEFVRMRRMISKRRIEDGIRSPCCECSIVRNLSERSSSSS